MTDLASKLCLESGRGILLTSPHNMRMASGFSGGEGYVLISEKRGYIIVDSRYTAAAGEEAFDGFAVREFSAAVPLKELLPELARGEGIEALVYEDEAVSVAELERLKKHLPNIEFVPAKDKIDRLRMIKRADELSLIAEAEQIGVEAFNHVLGMIKPGVTESEIAAELEYFMKKRGAQKTSFDTIVLSGARCALPHGVPGDNKVKKGDLVLMDFGCVYKGYCSDMTRTVAVGEPDPELKKIYEIVKDAQRAGFEAIRPGIPGKEPDAAARSVIEKAGYGKYFGHSLGHGVGLLIHELPNLSPKSEIILEPGMVVSCEPGIYIYGTGGVRIEDLVCVTEDGARNLTNLTKELIIL